MPTLLIEGDSIHASGLDVSAGSLRHRYISSAIPLRYGPFFDTYVNIAVGGSTIADAVGRADSAISTHSPDWTHIHTGTNDLPTTDLDVMVRGYMDLFSRYQLGDSKVVSNTILPRGGLSAEIEKKRLDANDALREMATSGAGFINKLVDFENIAFNPAQDTQDDLHPNVGACARVMDYVADQCATVLTNPTAGTNLFPNPNLWGIDGTDPMPDTVTIGTQPTGVTVTPVKDETTDYKQGFRVSGFNSGTGQSCIITLGSGISVTAGDSRYMSAKIKTVGLSGITGNAISIRYNTSPLQYSRALGNAGSDSARELSPDRDGSYTTMRGDVPATATSATLRFEWYFRDAADVSGLVILDDIFYGGVV